MSKLKHPWPTQKAMEQVYELNLWGGSNYEFYSGEGSHLPELVEPYLTSVIRFLTSFDPLLSICDLGCGDFNVGKHLFSYSSEYTAIDIVPKLIARNAQLFKADHLKFISKDISAEAWPSADCIILRQVLQHLSNSEVLSVVMKLKSYKYIILTEHTPSGTFTPNIDILSGQGIRLGKQSGIDLLAPPFNLPVKKQQELLKIHLGGRKGCLVTSLYTMS
ncbi:MAG: methyltransferase [Flavobacteriales bacterium]